MLYCQEKICSTHSGMLGFSSWPHAQRTAQPMAKKKLMSILGHFDSEVSGWPFCERVRNKSKTQLCSRFHACTMTSLKISISNGQENDGSFWNKNPFIPKWALFQVGQTPSCWVRAVSPVHFQSYTSGHLGLWWTQQELLEGDNEYSNPVKHF